MGDGEICAKWGSIGRESQVKHWSFFNDSLIFCHFPSLLLTHHINVLKESNKQDLRQYLLLLRDYLRRLSYLLFKGIFNGLWLFSIAAIIFLLQIKVLAFLLITASSCSIFLSVLIPKPEEKQRCSISSNHSKMKANEAHRPRLLTFPNSSC